MLDLATPWCLRVAATLRLPEHIVSQGVFTEESPGRFACNRAAEQLAGMPFLDLDGIGSRMAHTWGTLLDYVRTGQPAYRDRMTVAGQSFFGRCPPEPTSTC